MTTYFNAISGPRREGEVDGPREQHLIVLDSGLSQAYRDADFCSTLQCIRCGACAEVYPVGIPIPNLLMQLRHAAKHAPQASHGSLAGQAGAKHSKEALAWNM